MKIIVGLGNPDKKYENTRHNVGWLAVDQLAASAGLTWRAQKNFNALIAKGDDCLLVKPLTYMNQSGASVQKILNYYQLTPDDLTVIHDDLDIALGSYKYSRNSSSAGHYGVQSIINVLGTANFNRLRLGLATAELQRRRKSIWPNAVGRWVLKKFPAPEKPLIDTAIEEALKNL